MRNCPDDRPRSWSAGWRFTIGYAHPTLSFQLAVAALADANSNTIGCIDFFGTVVGF